MKRFLARTNISWLRDPFLIHLLIIAIISVGAGLLLYGLLPDKYEIWMFVNSDTRYMTAIYTDLFVHKSGLSGWHLPSSPNFFPDMLIFSLLMTLLEGHELTALVYGVLQLTTVVILINILIKTFDPELRAGTLFFLSLSILILPFSSILGESHLLPSQLLFNGYHCGFFINSLLAAIFSIHYARTGRRYFLVLAASISLLATLSDKLFIIGFVGPMLSLTLFNYFHRSRPRRYLILAGGISLSAIGGLGIFELISSSDAITFISTSWKVFNFQNIGPSFSELVIHMKSIIIKAPLQRLLVIMMLLFFVASPVYLLANLRRFMEEEEASPFRSKYKLLLYLALFSYMVFFTPVINGSYVGPAIIRYNYAALLMASLGFIYLLHILLFSRLKTAVIGKYLAHVCAVLLLLLLLQNGTKNQAGKGLSDFINYYPESARILDSLKSQHQLKYGVSEYWQALHNTQFSENDVRLYTVWDENFRPWYHATNENWYHDGGKGSHANPVFNYLVVDRFKQSDKLHQLFGSDMDTLYDSPDLRVIKVPEYKFDRDSREIFLLNKP